MLNGGQKQKASPSSKVEVRSFEDGGFGSWHPGKVIGCKELVRVVEYDHLLCVDCPAKLVEEVKVTPAIDGFLDEEIQRPGEYRGLIRPCPETPTLGLVGARTLQYGACVDLFHGDAWWEGVVFDNKEGCERRRIFFPDLGDEVEGKVDDLRFSKDWDEVTEKWRLQIWYEVRTKDDFKNLGEWTSSKRDIEDDQVRVSVSPTDEQVLSPDPDADSGNGSSSYDESHSLKLRQGRRKSSTKIRRLNWQSAVPQLIPGPQQCPDAIDSYKEYLSGKGTAPKGTAPNGLSLDVSKHLLKCYISPNGKTFHSLPEVFKKFHSDFELEPTSHVTMHPNYKIASYMSSYEETPSPPGKSQASRNLFKLPCITDEKFEIESKYCPKAVRDYCSLASKSAEGKLKGMEARKHLSALGWSFYHHNKGPYGWEIRYRSPTGKMFYSLLSACRWCVKAGALTSTDPSRAMGRVINRDFINNYDGDLSTSKSHLPRMADDSTVTHKTRMSRKKRRKLESDCLEVSLASPKRGRKSNASMSLRGDLNADSLTPVRQSSKRVSEEAASSSHQTPRTILSWLIDNNVVLPRAKVHYCSSKNGPRIAEGRISREGIKCSCCGGIFTLVTLKHMLAVLIVDLPQIYIWRMEVPEGDWFCPSCCCQICNKSRSDSGNKLAKDTSFLTCCQCERRYHAECLTNEGDTQCRSKGDLFCQDTCRQIFDGLNGILGKKIPVGTENMTWTLVKYMESNISKNVATYDDEKPRTRRDLMEDIIFNRRSDLNRLNFQGFYTVILEKNDELISAASVRIYGKTQLAQLGVERLLLPAVPSVLNTWISSFGFSMMDESERLNFLVYTFLDFQGTIFCQKMLKSDLPAENQTTGCDHVDNNADIGVGGISPVSEVLEGKQVVETDIMEQESACHCGGESTNCPGLLVSPTRPLGYPLLATSNGRQSGSTKVILKYYKRKKISAC
ncbi:hypothetical protein SASPL_157617 [Salvia splendens]|uniref:Agenet domain-containing protein n=1 Tax=Salvia splendens TaxID=180675 RepID=A0A8X8YV64_SALSN|nr:hypothetical protein SASPL_157617 [Salvia splendens]